MVNFLGIHFWRINSVFVGWKKNEKWFMKEKCREKRLFSTQV